MPDDVCRIDWSRFGLSEPEMLPVNGIDMAVWDSHTPSQCPPLVLCHGYPELAFSWRHQLTGLPKAGLRAIAPDLRGYGLTSAPDAIEAYDLATLTGDLAALLDAKGIERAVFCGHDWGGLIVWAMATRRPDRVAGVIGVNTPYTKRPPIDPIALYERRFGPDHYIIFFQKPGAMEAILEADIDKTFRFYMRRSTVSPVEFDARPQDKRNHAFQLALQSFGKTKAANPLLNPEEHAVYVDTFTRTGFRGGLNWYRNFTRNWLDSADIADLVLQPSLMIMAENDVVLPPSAADGMEKYVPNLDKVLIAGCGHWTQQEKPEETNQAIITWMKARFG
ncbi:epoxide hydrolase A [Candidatus Phycosocius bacilliformis]|uniref:Epoxide hydrolase A n=1 Tax=Candidatus Phycosocius bacilliformis TaxID=1445552 RepID=A0A2P2E8N6_9PROT|nr:alpha/beta hydrolase [Candidatus Phycosocius bacilliformis]GBF57401.1 epoxide hydrolase A [Candidatus Phycosocius bacilliformis]